MLRIAAVLLLVPLCHAFYLPGVMPHDYQTGEPVVLKVGAPCRPSGDRQADLKPIRPTN